jgi:hypothetical protein
MMWIRERKPKKGAIKDSTTQYSPDPPEPRQEIDGVILLFIMPFKF